MKRLQKTIGVAISLFISGAVFPVAQAITIDTSALKLAPPSSKENIIGATQNTLGWIGLISIIGIIVGFILYIRTIILLRRLKTATTGSTTMDPVLVHQKHVWGRVTLISIVTLVVSLFVWAAITFVPGPL